MQFIYFESRRVGINVDHLEWYSLNEHGNVLNIKLVSGQKYFVDDEDEISYFLDVVTGLEEYEE